MKITEWARRISANSRRKRRDQQRRRELWAELGLTRLETRRVLNGGAVTSAVVVDTGDAANDGQDDSIKVDISQNQVNVSVNGNHQASYAIGEIDALSIQGSQDNDQITVQWVDGPIDGLQIDIDGASGNDSLTLTESQHDLQHLQSIIHSIETAESGQLDLVGVDSLQQLDYLNLDSISNQLHTDDASVEIHQSGNQITLGSDLAAGMHLVDVQDMDGETFALRFRDDTANVHISSHSTGDNSGDQITIQQLDLSDGNTWSLTGDDNDVVSLTGQSDVGETSFAVHAGDLLLNGEIQGNQASLELVGTSSVTSTSEFQLSNVGGNLSIAGQSLEIAGTISPAGGNVTVDSGLDGTTIVRALIDVSDDSAASNGQQQIKILGQNVGLLDQATLDASGTFGGGAIYVGGGFQGSNPTIDNAQRTYVGSQVLLRADAIESGDGGQVIVWADDWTKFYGTIESRGGQLAGDGGDVEVSGKGTLTFAGNADLSAANGETGTLLLDPTNIVIDDGSGTENGQLADQQVLFAEGGATDSAIQPSAFETTNANITFQATNNITISSDIDLTNSGNTLAFQAGEDILINANLTSASGANNLIFEADSPHSGSNDGSGEVNFAAVSVSSNGGDITLIGASFDLDATMAAGAGDIYITTSNSSPLTISSSGISATEINNLSTSGTLVFGRATSAGTNNNGTGATTLTAASILVNSDTTINALTTSNIEMYATGGITLDRDLIATAAITMDADTDNDGTGTFTITASDDLRTNNNALEITAGDVAIAGDIDSGNAATSLIDSDGDGIGFGDTAVTDALNLSGAELQNIDSTGLTLQTTGAVTVDGVSAENSNSVAGTVTIDADTVTFSGDSSTFHALDVQADDQVTINTNITTETGALAIDGDANTSTDTFDDVLIAAGVTLDAQTDLTLAGTDGIAAAGALNLTAGGTLTISDALAVTGDLTITDESGNGIGLGDTAIFGGLNLTGADLANITVTNLELVTGASITVDNITAANSNNVTNLELSATGSVSFATNASIFNALDVKADDRVSINVDVTTHTGALSIDGNADNAADTNDDIQIADGVKVKAATVLTLAALTGGITTAGVATLTAGTDVVISNAVTAGGNLAINADDLTLSAAIGVGVNDLTITDNDGDGIGLGDASVTDGLNISNAELQLITADELNLITGGEIEVDNVTVANSSNVATVVLDATTDVEFNTAASTFNALNVQADDRVTFNVNVTTDTGAFSIDGDADAAADTNDDIQIADGVTLQSATSLTLAASDGGITTVGTANLNAGTDVTLSNAVTAGGDLGITTNDLALSAAISAGANSVTITDTDGTGIGLGDATIDGGVNLSGDELQLITANSLTLATSGAIEVDNVKTANSNLVTTVILDSGSSVLIDTVASTFNALDIQADDGVTINGNLTSDAGSITIDGDTNNSADGSDDVEIASGVTIDAATSLTVAATTGGIAAVGTANLTAGTDLVISDAMTAGGTLAMESDDLRLNAVLNAGVNDVTITDNDGDGIGLGDTAVTDGLNLSAAELQLITADALSLISAGEIEVDNITATNSKKVATVILESADFVRLSGSASTFNSLNVQADDGVIVNVNLTTDTGAISIDGDVNNAADGNDDVQFASGVTLNSATDISLAATTSGLQTGGALDLIANGTVTVSDQLAATGTLTLQTDDLNVTSTISSTADILITEGDGDGIGLGSTTVASGLNLTGAELQNLSATNLSLITSGSIVVNNISATNSDNISGMVTLDASAISFVTSASTFNSLDVQADDGVTVSADLTTETGTLTIDADDDAGDSVGTLTVDPGVNVSSSDHAIVITVNDVDIQGGIVSGNASTTIIDSDGDGIGLGSAVIVGGLNLSVTDLQDFTATGLTLQTAGNVDIDGMSQPITISGVTNVISGGEVNFITTASSFNALNVQADDGITANVNVTTTVGSLSLDGDADDALDTNDNILIGVGVQIASAGLMTLDATTGGIIGNGALTLNAADGITVNDSLTSSGALTFNSDTDAGDDVGTLTIAAGAAVSSANNTIALTIDDLDVQGTISSGASSTTITGSDGDGIGLGDTPVVGGLNISDSDLDPLTTTGLTLQTSGQIIVDNLSQPVNIAGTTTLDAGTTISFSNNASSFNSLIANADDGISVDANVTTTTGDLLIDGNSDGDVDATDNVTFIAGAQLQSAGEMTLRASTGGLSGAGALTLLAADGINIDHSLSTNGTLTIDADTDANDDDGTLTLAAGQTIDSNSNTIDITADDLSIGGSVTSGTAATSIRDSDGDGVGLGDAVIAGGLNLSVTDLQDFTAKGLTVGTAGNIQVDNFSPPVTVSGAMTLTADGATSTVSFLNNASSFNSLAINASDGVTVAANLSTTAGGLTIDADTDAGDGVGSFQVNAGIGVSSGNNTIDITTNDLVLLGTLNSGAALTTINDSDGTGIGLGDTAIVNGLNLTSATAGQITSTGLTLTTTGNATVNNFVQPGSISGTVTIQTGGSISFATAASSFETLDAQSNDGISVGQDITTTTGGLTLDGDANNTGDGSDNILFAANVVLQSAAEITLAATTGDMTATGALTINGDDGVTFDDSLSASGTLTINADSSPGDDDGTLTINTGATISTTNQAINITADSLSIDGSVDSGNAATTIVESDGDGISLGDTNVPGAMNFSAADLLNFSAGDFTLQTSGDITVDNATLPGSITGSAFLVANGTSSQIQFINNGSSFGTLTVSASDGVTVDTALATTGGALTIDADTDVGDNTGTFSVTVNGSLDSNGQAISITANDADFTGTVNSGAADVTVTDSDGTGLGLGSSVIINGLNISDAELDQITAVNFIGTSSGDIYVNGISQPGTISNEIQLAAGGTVFFAGTSSSFNSATVNAEDGIDVGIDVSSTGGDLTFDGDSDNAADTNDNIAFAAGTTVQAAGTLHLSATTGGMTGAGSLNLNAADGVNLNDSLATSGVLTINADQDANDNNGTLFIDAAATIDTNDNTLLVTANDFNVLGAVTSGTAATSLIDSDGDGVGFGDTAVTDGLNISMVDLASFTADGLNIQSTGAIVVDNVSLPISITGTTALQSGSSIQFSNNASTFPGLDAQAEDGIQVNVSVVTSSGDLLLNGDSDDAADTTDNITFVAGTSLNSAGSMTLQATTGGMTAAGALNLTANDGITVQSALDTSGTLTVIADNDAGDDSGTFAVAGTGSVDTNDNQLLITADDIDLSGSLDSGTATTVFTDSDGTSMGIGDSSFVNGFNLSSSELQNVTGTDVQFITSNYLVVDNITAASSDNLAGTTLLDAGSQLFFSNNASTFNTLDAQADNGLWVFVDVTTDTGSLSLDGDANDVLETLDVLQLSSAVTLTSADAITLEATNGNIIGLGSLNLNAADDVNIIDNMTVSGVLTVNADTDAGDNDGQFNIAATGSLDTSNNALVVTADSISLSGTVSSGAASTTFNDSDGTGIGLGSAAIANGLNLSNADTGQMTATGLTMTTAGNLDVQAFTQPGTITGTVTLTGSGGSSTASFSGGASSFSGLDLTVDDSMSVGADVSATTGDLKLSGGGTATVSAGNQLTGAGAGSTIEVTGGDITINNGSLGSESILNTADGSISLTSTTGNIDLGNFALASDTGIITVNSAGTIDEISDNSTVSLSTTGTVTLTAVGDIGQSAGVGLAGNGPLDVDVDSISATSTTGGVYLRDSDGLTVTGVGTNSADAELISDTSISLTGAITATTSGDISLSAPVISLSASGDITTDDGDISIDAGNAGGLTIDDGAVLTTDEGSISGQLINAADPFSGTAFTGEPLSDSDRNAIISVVIADSGATNVEVLINWGEGDTDEMTPVISAPPGDDRAFVVQSTMPAPAGGVDFIHDYQNPPDPDNPSDDIPVLVSINQFAAGTISLQENSASVFDDPRFDDFEVIVEVDSAILPFFLSIPEDNTQLAQPASDPVLVAPSKVRRTLSMTSNQIIASSIGSAEQVSQRYYVLRIVSFGEEGDIKLMKDGSEYRLPNLDDPDSEAGFQLNQLPELFERLPDDRYKIYLIDGQTERLVLEFIIRDGQPIEAEAEESQQPAAADQPAVEKQFELEPVIDDGVNAGQRKRNDANANGTLQLTSPVSRSVPAKMTAVAAKSIDAQNIDHQPADSANDDLPEHASVPRHQTPSVAQRLGTMPVAAAGSTLMMASMHQLRKRSARQR